MEPTNILWNIQCVNRTTRERIDKHLWLNTGTLSDEDSKQVLIAAGTPEILKYRHLFTDQQLEANSRQNLIGTTVGEYFEDEAGNRLTLTEFIAGMSGNKSENTVLLGRPESVCRIGPKPMANPNDWTIEKANTIARFLEVVKYLALSQWIRTPVSFQYTVFGGGLFQPPSPPGQAGPNKASRPQNFKRPDLYTINAVLVLIRQLAYDKLFADTCEIYSHHCPDVVKRCFAQLQQNEFDQTLTGEILLSADGNNGSKVLRLFLYEFGLIHSPKPSQTKTFREMIDLHGREHTFLAFHMTLQRLTASAMTLAPVVAQDFHYWLDTEKYAGPTRISFDEILADDEPGADRGAQLV